MRDIASLFVIVLLVYLFQCLCWAPSGAHVFSLQLGGERAKKHGFLWSTLKLTGYWANPLPPLQPLLVVDWPQFQPEPEILKIMPADAEPISLPWEQLQVTRSGTRLSCNGLLVLHGAADHLKQSQEFLDKLKRAKPRERSRLIEKWLHRSTDTAAIEERLRLFCRKSKWLDIAVNLQFFLLFMIAPMAFFRFGSRALWPTGAGVIATSMFIAWQSLRLHEYFFPGDADGRFKSVVGTVLSPIYAVRAFDSLARDLLAGFHPLAVAGVVCSQQDFEAFSGEQMRIDKFSHASVSWYGEKLQLALAGMLQKQGVDPTRLLAAPLRDPNCVLYCPRCHAQYMKVRGDCADCGYGDLREFEKQPAADKPVMQ